MMEWYFIAYFLLFSPTFKIREYGSEAYFYTTAEDCEKYRREFAGEANRKINEDDRYLFIGWSGKCWQVPKEPQPPKKLPIPKREGK